MAISDLLPRKVTPGKTRETSMRGRHEYDQNAAKTRSGEYISAYMCSPETATEEFMVSKQIYETITGRSQPEERDILMYRVIQSFKPGEISPEEANRVGYETAMRWTKGRHAFFVATHTDRQHIHNVRPDRAMRKAV